MNRPLRSDVQLDKDIRHTRNYSVQCLIVKIMKRGNTTLKQQLICETIELCKTTYLFCPEPRLVEEQIADLVRREYLTQSDPYHHNAEITYLP